MKRNFIPLSLLLVIVTLSIAQAFYFYPLMPERVASHFGAGGQADGWTSRSANLFFHLGTLGFFTVLALVCGLALPRIPTAYINLPHKQYWLSPQKREFTLGRMGDFFLWVWNASVALFLVVMQWVYQANLRAKPELGVGFWWAMVGFGAILLTLLGVYMLPFRKKPAAAADR